MLLSMLYVGTSGWSYADWQKVFYPKGVSGARRLAYYAERYNTVEINVTFYRFPTNAMLDAWNAALPNDFCAAVKGSRRITHTKELPAASTVKAFFKRIRELEALRVILWQLPPYRKRDDGYLEAFIHHVCHWAPQRARQVVEFRHPTWWNDTTAQVLAAHNLAFVQVSHSTLPNEAPRTANFAYLRFHGLDQESKYDYSYSRHELKPWAIRVQQMLRFGDVYAYFNNDYGGNALRNANELLGLVERSMIRERRPHP